MKKGQLIKRIDHIDIAVKDVEKAITVFQKMGFELLHRTIHEGGAAELKLPGVNQPIFEFHPIGGSHRKGEYGLIHIAFLVDSAQETYDELKAKDIPIPIAKGWKGPRFLKESGRNMVDCEEMKDWGSFFLQFVEKGRKPPITRQKGEPGIIH